MRPKGSWKFSCATGFAGEAAYLLRKRVGGGNQFNGSSREVRKRGEKGGMGRELRYSTTVDLCQTTPQSTGEPRP
jgi:hypothetical protein